VKTKKKIKTMSEDDFDKSSRLDLEAQKALSSQVSQLRSQLERLDRSKTKNEEALTSCVRILCYFVVVGIVVTVGLITLVVGYNVVPIKEKEFLVSVVLLVFAAILALLALARNTPHALLGVIFGGLGISCFVLGLVIFWFEKIFQ
jgi:hypothetical protein